MKRSKLCKAIAMAAALGGVGLGMYQPANAVNLPANSLGEVLIFPYYTTRDGWQTTLSFLNTDERNLIAVKFRFYEGYNSRDALDFNVLLSPGDVFSGVVEDSPAGPVFRRAPNDTSCTVPHIAFGNTTASPAVPSGNLTFSTAAFTGNSLVLGANRTNDDGGPKVIDRLREGYVLAIVMGHWPVPAVAPAAGTNARVLFDAVHDATGQNTAAECIAAANLFTQPNVTAFTAKAFGEPINVLRGNYTLLNVARGTSVGGNAVALANLMTVTPLPGDVITGAALVPPAPIGVGPRPACTVLFSDQFGPPTGIPVVWDPNANFAACPNLITAQQPFWFLEPSLNDAFPRSSITIENAVPGVAGLGATGPITAFTYGFQAVSEVLRAKTIVNEWSVNPNLGVSSAWVVTHPTKGFFVDRDLSNSPQAAVNTIRFPSAGPAYSVPPIAVDGFLAPFAKTFRGTGTDVASTDGTSCNEVGFRLFNRDEFSVAPDAGGVVPSPAQPLPNMSLCYETNVIPFDQTNLVFSSKLLPLQIQNVYDAVATVTSASPTMLKPFGWMRLDLDTDPAAKLPPSTLAGPGLPAVGFMLRQRVIPGTADTYSDISDHSFSR